MNGKDFIAVLEYANAFKKERNSGKKKIDFSKLDLAEVFLQLNAQEEKIKTAKKQIEQLLKKEEKKDDKKGLSAPHLAMWMLVTAPITGPLMLYYWSVMFTAITRMH